MENCQKSRFGSALERLQWISGMNQLCDLLKSMSCKYFHVRSNLGLIGFEYIF